MKSARAAAADHAAAPTPAIRGGVRVDEVRSRGEGSDGAAAKHRVKKAASGEVGAEISGPRLEVQRGRGGDGREMPRVAVTLESGDKRTL